MDRGIVYPGQIPLDTDVLSANRNTMIALGYIAQATLGTGIYADGLACNPTLPASMQVTIGPGSLTTMSIIDGSAYGTIAADLNPLVKMGINPFGSTSFTLTAPGTSGQSINYLIEAQLVEADGLPISLPYYNASNPSQPFTGPNNSQAQQNTVRNQRVGLQLKAGPPAGVGTQQTPSVDAGWVGLYTITVNFAQTTITSTSISVYPGAPFIIAKIPSLAPIFSPGLSGLPTAPTPPLTDVSNRLATTAFVNTFGRQGNMVVFNSNSTFLVPVNGGILRVKATVVGGGGSGNGCSSITAGNSFSSASGGGAGGVAIGIVPVTPGAAMNVVVGAGGIANSSVVTNPGTSGGTSSFGGLQATGGVYGFWNGVGSSNGGAGGVGTGGTLNFSGGYGSDGQSGLFIKSGDGADGPWGGKGRAASSSSGNAGNAVGPGSGGGGAYAQASGIGGNGAAGIVILEY